MANNRNGATIVDLARKLGVSAMTVSRALRGSGEVSEKTRQKVLGCAQEMGYRPNRWARSLVTHKTAIIGIVVPDISHSFFAEVTRGIEDVLGDAGYNILLCDSRLSAEKEVDEIEMLVDSRVEGLIVASEQTSPEVFGKLRKSGVPFVLVDRFFPRCNFPAVLVDDVAVGRLATEHLIQRGHRRIAHIQGPGISPAALRLKGYKEALKKHRIPINSRWVVPGCFDIASGREAMLKLLLSGSRPSAVFAANDPMAIGALYACRESGLQVPSDISVVGAGNIEGVHHPNPFLTTIDWPRQDLGRAAATLLLAAASGRTLADSPQMKIFPPRLLVRQSTASPPGD